VNRTTAMIIAALAIAVALPRPASAQASPRYCYQPSGEHAYATCGLSHERCQRSVKHSGGRCITDPRR
jgi:hypothetical protein